MHSTEVATELGPVSCSVVWRKFKMSIELHPRDTGEWVQLANLPSRRWAMGCGVVSVTGVDGSEQLEVVVAGGYEDPDDFGRLDVVEIFNIQDGVWRTGEFSYLMSASMTIELTELACTGKT